MEYVYKLSAAACFDKAAGNKLLPVLLSCYIFIIQSINNPMAEAIINR